MTSMGELNSIQLIKCFYIKFTSGSQKLEKIEYVEYRTYVQKRGWDVTLSLMEALQARHNCDVRIGNLYSWKACSNVLQHNL